MRNLFALEVRLGIYIYVEQKLRQIIMVLQNAFVYIKKCKQNMCVGSKYTIFLIENNK